MVTGCDGQVGEPDSEVGFLRHTGVCGAHPARGVGRWAHCGACPDAAGPPCRAQDGIANSGCEAACSGAWARGVAAGEDQAQRGLAGESRNFAPRCNFSGGLWAHHPGLDARLASMGQHQPPWIVAAEIPWRSSDPMGGGKWGCRDWCYNDAAGCRARYGGRAAGNASCDRAAHDGAGALCPSSRHRRSLDVADAGRVGGRVDPPESAGPCASDKCPHPHARRRTARPRGALSRAGV